MRAIWAWIPMIGCSRIRILCHEFHYGRGKLDATQKIAKSMLKRGVNIEIIMEDTALTREEVEKIKESL